MYSCLGQFGLGTWPVPGRIALEKFGNGQVRFLRCDNIHDGEGCKDITLPLLFIAATHSGLSLHSLANSSGVLGTRDYPTRGGCRLAGSVRDVDVV